MKLVTVTNREIIDDLRNIPNVTLVYPLKSFCVGYTDAFDILEIDERLKDIYLEPVIKYKLKEK